MTEGLSRSSSTTSSSSMPNSPLTTRQTGEPLLEVRDLRKHFPIRRGLRRRVTGQVRAVDGVSLTVGRGETLGLVGESGCGKTTVGRCVLRLQEPSGGKVVLHGEGEPVDLVTLSRAALRR